MERDVGSNIRVPMHQGSWWTGAPRSVVLTYEDENYLMVGYLGDNVMIAKPGIDPFWVNRKDVDASGGEQNKIDLPAWRQ